MYVHYANEGLSHRCKMPFGEVEMTQYTVEKIENGIATLRYADNSWAEIVLSSDMTQEDLDDQAWQFRPKTGVAPSFVSEGSTSTASQKPEPIVAEEEVEDIPEYLQNRQAAYGDVASQIEYITENGLEAWQAHVAAIKAKYPEPSGD